MACRSGACQHRLSDVEEPVSDRREFTVHSRTGLGAAQGHVLDVENSAGQQIQFVDRSVIRCRCIVIRKAIRRVPFIGKGSVPKQLEKDTEGTKIHVKNGRYNGVGGFVITVSGHFSVEVRWCMKNR